MTDEQMAREMAKMLDVPIENLKQSQQFLRDGNFQGALLNLALAKAFLDSLTGLEEQIPASPAQMQERGYETADNTIEFAKGLAARVFKGVFGVDPRDDSVGRSHGRIERPPGVRTLPAPERYLIDKENGLIHREDSDHGATNANLTSVGFHKSTIFALGYMRDLFDKGEVRYSGRPALCSDCFDP